MIKSTPNSNLLTVADSPFQHHLVSLVIYLYIYRHIQMVLDASTTKEESLAYNPQGGRIVLHTACDKEVATFAFGQEAQWRNGKDNRQHLYVEGNPVSYRDPSGNALSNSWLYAIGTYFIAKSQGMNDQQAMIYAASAYGVGRAKDRNKGDFWKHNDISRGITSAWKSYLKTDFGKFSTNSYNLIRKTDIGVSITKNWQGTVRWAKSLSTETIIVIITNIAIILIGIFVLPSVYIILGGIFGLASTFGADTDFPDGGEGSTINEYTYGK